MQEAGDGLRVLIVDDHADTAIVHQMLLEAEGHFVVTAGSAEDALDKVDELKPDVAVLDLRLPGLSGTELLQLLKKRPDLARCRYICVSGSDGRDVQWQQLGFDAFLQKPIAIDELRAMVRLDRQL